MPSNDFKWTSFPRKIGDSLHFLVPSLIAKDLKLEANSKILISYNTSTKLITIKKIA